MSETLVQAQEVTKTYRSRSAEAVVLRGIDLEIVPGDRLAITGASGSGKSTLLHLLGALDRPTAGTILFQGQDLSLLNDRALSRIRNQSIGFVFQFHHLLPEFTVRENVMMPLLVRGEGRGEAGRRAEGLLESLGLIPFAQVRPTELSGGEQQRVAVARALVGEPSLVLADEPTGNLDRETGEQVFSLLHELCDRTSMALVIVTHNEALAQRMPKRLKLADGLLDRLS